MFGFCLAVTQTMSRHKHRIQKTSGPRLADCETSMIMFLSACYVHANKSPLKRLSTLHAYVMALNRKEYFCNYVTTTRKRG